MASLYYIQPLTVISVDYRVNLKLDYSEPDLLIPRNFFTVIGKVRCVYLQFCKEVKSVLECVEYFTDDMVGIVLSYSL